MYIVRCLLLFMLVACARSYAQPIIDVGDHDFGSVPVGADLTAQITVRNASTTSPLTIRSTTVPDDESFTVIGEGIPEGSVLAPNETRTIAIRFSPPSAGEFNGRLIVHSDASPSPQNDSIALLSGRGTGSISASDYDFGDVVLPNRETTPGQLEIFNGGDVAVRLVGIDKRVGDSAVFTFPDPASYTNVTIAPNSSVGIPVTFNPVVPGRYAVNVYWAIEPSPGVLISRLTGSLVTPISSPFESSEMALLAIVSIIPNPSLTDHVRVVVRMDVDIQSNIDLITSDGLIVRSWILDRGTRASHLDLSGIAAGSYFVRLTAGNRSTMQSLVVR